MKVKVITVLIFTLLVGLWNIGIVNADNRDIDSVNEDISKIEKEIIEAIDEVEYISNKIESTKDVVIKNEEEIIAKKDEIKELNKEVDKLNEEIIKLEKDIEIRSEIINNRLRSLQMSGGQKSYLDVLFGSTSFEDFISRLYASRTIMQADNVLIDEQENDVIKVEKNKEIINSNLDEAKKYKNELEEIKKENEVKKEKLIEKKNQIKNNKESLEKKKNDYIKEGNDIKQLEKKAQVALETKNTVENKSSKKSSLETKAHKSNKSSAKTFTMEATAYTAECKGCSGITATGLNLNKNRHMKVVAVDPSVIPLGSRVWVEGYGEAIAGDTGGAIKGNKIDLHLPTKGEALAFGRRNVSVTILN